jgi:hypothetical protein
MSCHEMNHRQAMRMRDSRAVNWKACLNCRANSLPRTTGRGLRDLIDSAFLHHLGRNS